MAETACTCPPECPESHFGPPGMSFDPENGRYCGECSATYNSACPEHGTPPAEPASTHAEVQEVIEGSVLELAGHEWRVVEVRFASEPVAFQAKAVMHLTLMEKTPEPPLDPWTMEMREVRPEFCWRVLTTGVCCIRDLDHEGECG